MDDRAFDGWVRRLADGSDRRTALRVLAWTVAVPAAVRVAAAAGAGPAPAACRGIGARCGRRKQPGCGQCCSGYTSRQNNGQRRCTCRPDLVPCRRNDQCCSGLCCEFEGEQFCIPGIFSCDGTCPDEPVACAA